VYARKSIKTETWEVRVMCRCGVVHQFSASDYSSGPLGFRNLQHSILSETPLALGAVSQSLLRKYGSTDVSVAILNIRTGHCMYVSRNIAADQLRKHVNKMKKQ
jgi:hypothetical protein